MTSCLVCRKPIQRRQKFCSRQCYADACRRGLIRNSGQFKKGHESPNKGRTLESWVGEARASEIRLSMSVNSRKKAVHLRRLNRDPSILQHRIVSRKFHDAFVEAMVARFRASGLKCFTLSEYVKEKRIPDAIIFDGKQLVALEVEQQKRYKPSHAAIIDRLTRMNSLCNFFGRTIVVFPRQSEGLDDQVDRLMPAV